MCATEPSKKAHKRRSKVCVNKSSGYQPVYYPPNEGPSVVRKPSAEAVDNLSGIRSMTMLRVHTTSSNPRILYIDIAPVVFVKIQMSRSSK